MRRTPMKAIRAKCLDCSGGSPKEVGDCLVNNGPLFQSRMGLKTRWHLMMPIDSYPRLK